MIQTHKDQIHSPLFESLLTQRISLLIFGMDLKWFDNNLCQEVFTKLKNLISRDSQRSQPWMSTQIRTPPCSRHPMGSQLDPHTLTKKAWIELNWVYTFNVKFCSKKLNSFTPIGLLQWLYLFRVGMNFKIRNVMFLSH